MFLSPASFTQAIQTAQLTSLVPIIRELTRMKDEAEYAFWSKLVGARIHVYDNWFGIKAEDYGYLSQVGKDKQGVYLMVTWPHHGSGLGSVPSGETMMMRPPEIHRVVRDPSGGQFQEINMATGEISTRMEA